MPKQEIASEALAKLDEIGAESLGWLQEFTSKGIGFIEEQAPQLCNEIVTLGIAKGLFGFTLGLLCLIVGGLIFRKLHLWAYRKDIGEEVIIQGDGRIDILETIKLKKSLENPLDFSPARQATLRN